MRTLLLAMAFAAAGPGGYSKAADESLPDTPRKPDRLIEVGSNAKIRSVAVSPDGATAWVHATAAKRANRPAVDALLVVNLRNGKVESDSPAWDSGDSGFERMLVSGDRKSALVFVDSPSSRKPRGIRQFDIQTGKQLREFPLASQRTFGAQTVLSTDGRTLYTSAGDLIDAELIAFDLGGGRETGRVKLGTGKEDSPPDCVRLFSTFQGVIVVDGTRTVRGWRVGEKELRTVATVGDLYKSGCWIEPPPVWVSDTRVYAVTTEEKPEGVFVRGWDLKTGNRVVNIKSPIAGKLHRVVATADDRLLLCGTDEPSVMIYDLAQGRWIDTLDTPAFGISYNWPLGWLNVSADGRTLVAVKARDEVEAPWLSKDEVLAIFDLTKHGSKKQ